MKHELIMELIETAAEQLQYSYVPYSGFRVGKRCVHSDKLRGEDCYFQGGQRRGQRLSGNLCGRRPGRADGILYAALRSLQTGDDGILRSGGI